MIATVNAGVVLSRIHRSRHAPLHFRLGGDADSRQRWDSPDGSYGVCYMAEEGYIAFAETLLRDLRLDSISEAELKARSLARLRVRAPLCLVAMQGKALRAHGADASVVQGPYPTTWEWSAVLHSQPGAPDGIYYRARHDDSGFSIALFDRAQAKVEHTSSVELLDPILAGELAQWLDRYEVGLTS
ncbi:RES family NAD+ phosphorylase [soil metagenome]